MADLKMMHSRTSVSIKPPQTLSDINQGLEVLRQRGQKLGENEAYRHAMRDQVGTMVQHGIAPGQVEGDRAVISQLTNALVRAVLVALMVMSPSLLISPHATNTEDLVLILAIIMGSMVFLEYYGRSPSFIEFRFAPPFNRLRFLTFSASLLAISLIVRGETHPTEITAQLTQLGAGLGNAIDFPYSPVRLMVIMLPPDASAELVSLMRVAAGIAYTCSLVMIFVFLTLVRLLGWPKRSGAFNVWINLPLFDPTGGGDVLARLKRDAALNIVMGVLLPFIIPATVKTAAAMVTPVSMQDPQTLIWMVTIWAFLPASLLMRGIAMSRVADMIEEKRKRAYAAAGGLQEA